MIVDYDYYINTYKGISVESENFESLEIKASSQVLNLIMNRDYTNWFGKDYSEQVKKATCSVIDLLNSINQKESIIDEMSTNTTKIITSEKVGDYSRNFETTNYKDIQEQIANKKAKIVEEVSEYLWYTGLMNRGVCYVQ